jgi:hypothetical protein
VVLSRAVAAAALAVVALLAGSASASAATSLLFVQQTDGGTLTKTGASTFRLTLRGVAPSVTTFTDRPARAAGAEPAARFLARWRERGFAAEAPNAALVMDGAPKDRDVVILTLSHPRYHPRTRTFTYAARPVPGTSRRALQSFAARRDPVRELRFGAASLFIDDASDLELSQMILAFNALIPGQQLGVALENVDGGNLAFSVAAGVTSLVAYDSPAHPVMRQVQVLPDRITISWDPNAVFGLPQLPFIVYFATSPAFGSEFILRDISTGSAGLLQAFPPGNIEIGTPISKTGTRLYWG